MATIATGLVHSVIPAYQTALQHLATQGDRTFLAVLLQRAAWVQGFSEGRGEEDAKYAEVVHLIRGAVAGETVEDCLTQLVRVGAYLEEHYPAGVQQATSLKSVAVDPARLLAGQKLFD